MPEMTKEYTQWEYKTVSGGVNLKKLGEEGWEMTGVIRLAEYQKTFYFKRPIK